MSARDLFIDIAAGVLVIVLFVRAYVKNVRAHLTPDMLTLRQASTFFLIPEQRVKEIAMQGLINSWRILGRRYVSKESLSHYLNQPAEPANNSLPDLPKSGNNPT